MKKTCSQRFAPSPESLVTGGHLGETLLNLRLEKSGLVANGTTRVPFAVFFPVNELAKHLAFCTFEQFESVCP